MRRVITVSLLALSFLTPPFVQKGFSADKPEYRTLSRSQMITMLSMVEGELKDLYFDPSLRGVDLQKAFNHAKEKIGAAQTQDEGLLAIAAAVKVLHDSHTAFIPPVRPYTVNYGFQTQAIGDRDCFVVAVQKGSDAEARGLKPGDRIVSINGVPLARADLTAVEYGYHIFPQSGFHLEVQSPDGTSRPLTVMAKVIPGQRVVSTGDLWYFMTTMRNHEDVRRMMGPMYLSRFAELDKKVVVWKLPSFAIDARDIKEDLKHTAGFDTIILDLRGNPGGAVSSLQELTSRFFAKDIKIADLKTRRGMKAEIARGRGSQASQAKLIVLVDSKSSSAAEIFARVVQLEKRGVVLGDRSSGLVMESAVFTHAIQMDPVNVTQYHVSISVADVIMTDGKSLEDVGVTPDERVVPTAADLAAGRDPVLARAAAAAGAELTPEKAGALFPVLWDDKPFKIE